MQKLKPNHWLLGISIGLFVMEALFLFKSFNQSEIAVVDTQALVAIEAQKMANLYPKGNIPPEKLQTIAEQLKKVVEQYAKDRKIVLLAKGAVWGGVLPDHTETLIELLKEE